MPSAEIATHVYSGSLLGAELLSEQRTIVLNHISGPSTGTLVDDDNSFGSADDGTATYNGMPITYIGSGTSTPGVNIAGVTVPLGTPKPLVAFEAGGTIYFHYPEGPPNLIGAVAQVIDLEDVPYTGLTPVCFCAGTLITTKTGPVPVEELAAGDIVMDVYGCEHAVRWVGGGPVDIAGALPGNREKLYPVCIPAGSQGPGQPAADLYVSQQHRVLINDPLSDLMFASPSVLAPAVSLLESSAHIDRTPTSVSYYHVLCDEHAIILANEMPCESLFLGQESLRNVRAEHADEIELLVAAGAGLDAVRNSVAAAPFVTRTEGRTLALLRERQDRQVSSHPRLDHGKRLRDRVVDRHERCIQ